MKTALCHMGQPIDNADRQISIVAERHAIIVDQRGTVQRGDFKVSRMLPSVKGRKRHPTEPDWANASSIT
jgi:hypothetical protein